MEIKSLSLVIPSYKQEKTIVSDIRTLQKNLSSLPYELEIIVVLDGEVDNSLEKLKKAETPHVKTISYKENQGKGYAVKKGMLLAKGDVVGFFDGGRDISLSSLLVAIDLMKLHDAEIVIGSKLHPDSVVNYPPIRKIISWIARTITRILFNFDVKDTQVGLKLFRKDVAHAVFSRIIIKAFAFDVEVLAVARRLGYRKIFETPVKINFKPGSINNVNFLKICLFTFWDVLAIFYRMYILKYYDK